MKAAMVVAFAGLMAVAGPAGAAHVHERASDQSVSHRDPSDVGNRLDIRRVAFKGNRDGSATISIETYRDWSCEYINRDLVHDGGVASVRWHVNTNRDPYTERTAFFSCDRGEWSLSWSRGRTFDAFVRDGNTLSATIPLDDLGIDHRRHLSFTALTFANGKFGSHIALEETDAAQALAPLAD